MEKYYVSFDRLAGPHSRHLHLSKPFNTMAEAFAYLENIIDQEDPIAAMRIENEATVVSHSKLFANCEADICLTCKGAQ